MTLRICTILPDMSTPIHKIKRRPGGAYDIRRPAGHAMLSVLCSVDPPRLRFWDPYCDVEISRKDAALLLRSTRRSYRSVQQAVREGKTDSVNYVNHVDRINYTSIHDINRWEIEREFEQR